MDDLKIQLWDLGGQQALRTYWSNYFDKTSALVYVIDSADEDRVVEAGEELKKLLAEKELANIPVLVFANKQDLVHAQGPDEITEKLQLDKISNRKWSIMACSALENEGVEEGF